MLEKLGLHECLLCSKRIPESEDFCSECQQRYSQEIEIDFKAWFDYYLKRAGVSENAVFEAVAGLSLFEIPISLFSTAFSRLKAGCQKALMVILESVLLEGRDLFAYFQGVVEKALELTANASSELSPSFLTLLLGVLPLIEEKRLEGRF